MTERNRGYLKVLDSNDLLSRQRCSYHDAHAILDGAQPPNGIDGQPGKMQSDRLSLAAIERAREHREEGKKEHEDEEPQRGKRKVVWQLWRGRVLRSLEGVKVDVE